MHVLKEVYVFYMAHEETTFMPINLSSQGTT